MANDPKTAAQPGAMPQQVTGQQTVKGNVPPAPTVNPQQVPVPQPAQPAPTPAPPQPLPPAAGQPAGTEPVDFEKKFKGLQAVHQSLAEKHKTLETTHGTLTQQVTELQTTLEATRTQLDALKADKDTSDQTANMAQEELADYRLWERKLDAIRKTAPNLLPFEKNIVLELPAELENPDPAAMTDDQLKVLDGAITQAITEFGEAMAGYIKDMQASQHAGVVPPSSPGRGSEEISLETLYDMAIEKAGTPEGDQLMAQFTKLAEQDDSLGRRDGSGLWRPPS